MDAVVSFNFAYYCSGHGLGHATRVVAISQAALDRGHRVHIVTDAKPDIFDQVVRAGATYRQSYIDAGVVQPKAYDVNRSATVDRLTRFLLSRPDLVQSEARWLISAKIDAVLVDAPFLPWSVFLS